MSKHVIPATRQLWQIAAPGLANLAFSESPMPLPRAGEILVRVGAVSLNYRDSLLVMSGFGLPKDMAEPLVPGSDAAGTVVAVGEGVSRFKAGDRVITTFIPDWIDGPGPGTASRPNGLTLGGAAQGVLADHIVISQEWAVRAPATLSDAEASTLSCAGLTAWTALVERGRLRAGETVVLLGTGGVALFGLQIAAAHGARTIVVSGDEGKLDKARALGAAHVVNRSKEDWVAAVRDITRDHGADHILETVGGSHMARSLEAAAVCGRVYLIGVQEGFELSMPFVPLALKRLSVEGIQVGHRRGLENLVAAFDTLGLKPVIEASYELAALPDALAHLDRGPFGKVVVVGTSA